MYVSYMFDILFSIRIAFMWWLFLSINCKVLSLMIVFLWNFLPVGFWVLWRFKNSLCLFSIFFMLVNQVVRKSRTEIFFVFMTYFFKFEMISK